MNRERNLLLSASRMLQSGFIFCVVLQFADVKADDWTTYQHDSAHTGRSAASFDPLLLKKMWTGNSSAVPLVVGNTLYALGASVTSYNLFSGAKNWSQTYG